MCLANPPFKGTVDAESINDNLKAVTNTKKTELLFLALFLRMLKNVSDSDSDAESEEEFLRVYDGKKK